MRFTELTIPGVWLIDAEPFKDERGIFRRHYCEKEFATRGIETRIVQANISENVKAFTLRGLHYQAEPYGEAKTISCVSGAAKFVVVDLRPESKTYMQWVDQWISKDDRNAIHVPVGCAVGFLTIQDRTWMNYFCSAAYVPGAERGIRWDDPAIGIRWPFIPRVMSEKDKGWPLIERK